MKSFDIEDFQLTALTAALSIGRSYSPPWNARLDSPGFGKSISNNADLPYYRFRGTDIYYLQVDLLVAHRITAMVIQGNPDYNNYVSTFKITYSNDFNFIQYLTADGRNEVRFERFVPDKADTL
jgi:hypothetical protein